MSHDPITKRDIWTTLFDREKQALIDKGIPADKADDLAWKKIQRELRRDIRKATP